MHQGQCSLSHLCDSFLKTISAFKQFTNFLSPISKTPEGKERRKKPYFIILKFKILSLPGFESPLPDSDVGFLRMSHSFNYFSTGGINWQSHAIQRTKASSEHPHRDKTSPWKPRRPAPGGRALSGPGEINRIDPWDSRLSKETNKSSKVGEK